MRVQFDRFYSYADLTETLESWAAEFPSLFQLEPIGQSYEGRDIWLCTVTNTETGPADEKPAAVDQHAHQRLDAGDEDSPSFQQEFVV